MTSESSRAILMRGSQSQSSVLLEGSAAMKDCYLAGIEHILALRRALLEEPACSGMNP